jgi:hypothetical protein
MSNILDLQYIMSSIQTLAVQPADVVVLKTFVCSHRLALALAMAYQSVRQRPQQTTPSLGLTTCNDQVHR